MNKISSAIYIEHQRQKAANDNDVEKLISLYKKYDEIPNLNTENKWDHENQHIINKNNNPMAWDRVVTIANWIGDIKPKKVLNIGIGSGVLEEIILPACIDKDLMWLGLDISNKSIEKAKKLHSKHKFLKINFQDFISAKNKYDLIIASEILEHINPSEIFSVLKKIFNLLKNNGNFICSVPLNEGLEKMLLKDHNPNAHVRIYSSSLIKTELKISKMKILKTKELYAYHIHYSVKSLFAKFLKRKPNNIIILAKKQ